LNQNYKYEKQIYLSNYSHGTQYIEGTKNLVLKKNVKRLKVFFKKVKEKSHDFYHILSWVE
jgi:hypothetical protein